MRVGDLFGAHCVVSCLQYTLCSTHSVTISCTSSLSEQPSSTNQYITENTSTSSPQSNVCLSPPPSPLHCKAEFVC